MKKTLAILLLALCLALTLGACSEPQDVIDDPVIDIGTSKMTYTENGKDVFTYEYKTSTTVVITDYTGEYEPHTLVIPEKIGDRYVAYIGDSAFRASSNILSIETKAPLVSIGNYAFADCAALTSLDIPDSVTEIGKGAFYQCQSLTDCSLPAELTSIGDHAFYLCTSLESITFPTKVTSLGVAAFYGCSALTEIVLPEGIAKVGAQAFYNCSAVTSLTLPASLTNIGDWAFATQLVALSDDAISTVEGSYAASYVKEQRQNNAHE